MKKLLFLVIFFFIRSVAASDLDHLNSVSCPDNGIKIRKTLCCKNGFVAELSHDVDNNITFGAYTQIVGECGCPNGGIQSKEIPSACCKDGFRYSTYYKDYTSIDFKTCGQPKEGHRATNGSNVLCKDGFRYEEDTRTFSRLEPDDCGCPKGAEYNKNYNVCCRDGYRLNERGTNLIWHDACGCPAGTKDSGANICCSQNKQGLALTNEELWGPVVEAYWPSHCGCPDDGKLVGDPFGISPSQVCCKYGRSFDKEKGKYSEWMPRCVLNFF